METSPSIYPTNHWTGFYMIGPSGMKESNQFPGENPISHSPFQISKMIYSAKPN